MNVPRGTLLALLLLAQPCASQEAEDFTPRIHLEDDEPEELPPAKVKADGAPPIHLPDDERDEDEEQEPIEGTGPRKSEPQRPDAPVRFRAWTGRYHGFTAESSDDGWLGAVAVEGPVAGVPKLGLRVELLVGGEPGEELDLFDPETWGNRAELRLGLSFPLARLEAGGQIVTTEGVAFWGAAVPLDETGDPRSSRAWGIGFRLAERVSGAFLELALGRDEAAGPWGKGQLLLRGLFPLVRLPARTSVAIVGDAVVAVSRPPGQRDFQMRLGVVLAR